MNRRSTLMLLGGTAGGLGAAALLPTTDAAAQAPGSRTMEELTFPEFEKELGRTDICLLPIGAIEEHGPHLPLNSDAIGAVAQLKDVQLALSARGLHTLVGPCLNIGITNEGEDGERDGTSIYPGSLTIGFRTFVNLYIDLLRSLHSNGLTRIFLYSGHLGGKHLRAVAHAAMEAREAAPELQAFALIDSERLDRLELPSHPAVLPIPDGLNFPMLQALFGGSEPAFTTHADGWETSLMLHYQPSAVRNGYLDLPQVSSPRFLEAQQARDRSLNPTGVGGFPTSSASSQAGAQIASYRTTQIVKAVLSALT